MKKMFLCFAIIFFTLASITAAEMKYYSDSQNGYSGYAVADYVGTTKTVNPSVYLNLWENDLYQRGYIKSGYCNKLSNQESFLLWKALGEYDYRGNEVYAVRIIQGNSMLIFTVAIKKRGSCTTYGGSYLYYQTWY